ncbi:MAG: SDR family NAD(P)-dependent oxidoreductase [Streptosporangiaceae bacterium]
MGVFTGKTAVVTGASSGIGRAVALHLGEAGAHVFAAGRRAEALAGTVQRVAGAGGAATAVAADLRDPGAVQGLVDRAMTGTGRLDVMVNNAGVSPRSARRSGRRREGCSPQKRSIASPPLATRSWPVLTTWPGRCCSRSPSPSS